MVGASNRDRQAERREATRREILDAAWDLSRELGLTQWTLRDVAARIGMRAPSLYFHFPSKNAIYDAMFGQAWSDIEEVLRQGETDLPASPRDRVKSLARAFFDFAAADLARYQLMNQRSIPGFEPSAESFASSQRVVQHTIDFLADLGVTDRGAIEINFALLGGLVDQQLANDPGGDSRKKLVDRAIDMWADAVGIAEN